MAATALCATSADLMAGRGQLTLPSSPVAAQPLPHALSGALQTARALPTASAIREATLSALASAPFVVETAAVAQPLRELNLATSPTAARQAAGVLVAAVRSSHAAAITSALTEACREAAIEVGFPSVEIASPVAGLVRVFAADAAGRGIVTEIRTNEGAGTVLEAEVVGVGAPACEHMLAAFEGALARRGVEMDVAHTRPTGGVPTTAVAREFVGRQRRRERERERIPRPTGAASPATSQRPSVTRPRPRQRQGG
jgi:hypothetical protein